MTAKVLIEQLSKVAPDTEIVGGMFNGRVETYTVLDELHVFFYDDIYNDFFGTPEAFDNKLMTIKSEKVVCLGSFFESTNKRVMEDRHFVWQLRKVLRQHRSKEWKKEQLYKLLTEFDHDMEVQLKQLCDHFPDKPFIRPEGIKDYVVERIKASRS